MKLLLNQDPSAGGGGQSDWKASLPEELRSAPSLQTFKSIEDLTKSYLSAQSLIGTKRLPAPQPNWQEKDWEQLYSAIGRPEAPDKYKVPEYKFEDGLNLDEGLVEKAKLEFHKNGLTPKQAENLLNFYFGVENERFKGSRSSAEQARAQAEEAMKKEWGDKYSQNVELAQSVLAKFDDDKTQFRAFLNESKLGNDPKMVKFLVNIASKLREDKPGGGATELNLPDSSRAKMEIEQLKGDKEFMDRFINGDKWALNRWNELHNLAYQKT